MAQADSVPSSSRRLITGEAASQSTNLPAISQRAVGIQPVDRRSTVGGSYAPAIKSIDDAPPSLWQRRRKRGDLLKSCCYGANAGPAPVGSNIGVVFCVNAAFFLGRLFRRILLILRRFVSRNKLLRNGAPDQVSSNQLVPSRPQGRLR
jgi:hypothetical protein